MIYSMGNTGQLPGRWAEVHDRRSPRLATGVVIASSAVLAVIGGLPLLAEAAHALVYVMFLVMNVVVILLRRRELGAIRPFKIAGTIKDVPVLPVLGIASTLTMSYQLDLQPLLAACGLLAMGVILHVVGQQFSPTGRAH